MSGSASHSTSAAHSAPVGRCVPLVTLGLLAIFFQKTSRRPIATKAKVFTAVERFRSYLDEQKSVGRFSEKMHRESYTLSRKLERFLAIKEMPGMLPSEMTLDLIVEFEKFCIDEYLYAYNPKYEHLYPRDYVNNRWWPKKKLQEEPLRKVLIHFHTFWNDMVLYGEVEKSPYEGYVSWMQPEKLFGRRTNPYVISELVPMPSVEGKAEERVEVKYGHTLQKPRKLLVLGSQVGDYLATLEDEHRQQVYYGLMLLKILSDFNVTFVNYCKDAIYELKTSLRGYGYSTYFYLNGDAVVLLYACQTEMWRRRKISGDTAHIRDMRWRLRNLMVCWMVCMGSAGLLRERCMR